MLLQIVLRTAVIYLLVLIGVRLSGKREVGQMTPFDLTLLLLLSNSVQNAMTGPDTSAAGRRDRGEHTAGAQLRRGRGIRLKPPPAQVDRRAAHAPGARWQDHRRSHGAGARQHGRTASRSCASMAFTAAIRLRWRSSKSMARSHV